MPLPTIRLLNRQMGHGSIPVILKGHSGRAYGAISRFSPADNCHVVELTFEAYEAARADLSKAMRLHARRIWEVAVVVEEGKDEGGGMKDEETLQKRISEPEALLEERREAMAEQGNINLQLREELAAAVRTANPPTTPPVPHGTGPQSLAQTAAGAEQGKNQEPRTKNQELLPPVSERTPWNELQKIAKAEGIDLKKHNNKPALLKALAEQRARFAVGPAYASRSPIPEQAPKPAPPEQVTPMRRLLREWSEQNPKTLDVVFFAEIVADETLYGKSGGSDGKSTLKSEPMPCRDKEEFQKARATFSQTLTAQLLAA